MKAVFRQDASPVVDDGGVELRLAELGGGMSATFVRLPAGADLRPALKGMPDDLCQCPHWGYILAGRVEMHTSRGSQEYRAGQAVYWAPGHAPVALEDTEYVDFSPTDEFRSVLDHLTGAN